MAAKRKEPENTLAVWASIIRQQGEQNKALDFMASARDIDNARLETAELFHKLWGEAHDSPEYNKENWKRMQFLLEKLGIKVQA